MILHPPLVILRLCSRHQQADNETMTLEIQQPTRPANLPPQIPGACNAQIAHSPLEPPESKSSCSAATSPCRALREPLRGNNGKQSKPQNRALSHSQATTYERRPARILSAPFPPLHLPTQIVSLSHPLATQGLRHRKTDFFPVGINARGC